MVELLAPVALTGSTLSNEEDVCAICVSTK